MIVSVERTHGYNVVAQDKPLFAALCLDWNYSRNRPKSNVGHFDHGCFGHERFGEDKFGHRSPTYMYLIPIRNYPLR